MKSLNVKYVFPRCLLLLIMFSMVSATYAKCGAVDYSWGADGLEEATSFVGTMMIYAVEILYAVAVIMAIISSFQIGIKMNYHEGDITKSMMMLFGAILFMIGATIVMPALYGYQDMTFVF